MAAAKTVGRNQFHCAFAHALGIKIAGAPAVVDPDIAPDSPTQFLQALQKRRVTALRIRVAHSIGWLCPPGERPHGCRTAQQRDEVASLHSITSSVSASSLSGISRPSVLAVLRLITNSYFVGTITGKSEGLVPLRMRPAQTPACRYASVILAP